MDSSSLVFRPSVLLSILLGIRMRHVTEHGLKFFEMLVDGLMKDGHTVYVHCNAGMNRSPSTVIAYLHWIEGQALEEAVRHVTRCRSCSPYVDAIMLATEDRARARDDG